MIYYLALKRDFGTEPLFSNLSSFQLHQLAVILRNRGYYMPARGYEFYVRVFNSLTREIHEKMKFVSTSVHVMFCLLYKHINDDFFYNFPKFYENSPKVVRGPVKHFRR